MARPVWTVVDSTTCLDTAHAPLPQPIYPGIHTSPLRAQVSPVMRSCVVAPSSGVRCPAGVRQSPLRTACASVSWPPGCAHGRVMGSSEGERRGGRYVQGLHKRSRPSTAEPDCILSCRSRCYAVKQETSTSAPASTTAQTQAPSTRASPPQPPYRVVVTGGTKASAQPCVNVGLREGQNEGSPVCRPGRRKPPCRDSLRLLRCACAGHRAGAGGRLPQRGRLRGAVLALGCAAPR
jgi:hypothetical protein